MLHSTLSSSVLPVRNCLVGVAELISAAAATELRLAVWRHALTNATLTCYVYVCYVVYI